MGAWKTINIFIFVLEQLLFDILNSEFFQADRALFLLHVSFSEDKLQGREEVYADSFFKLMFIVLLIDHVYQELHRLVVWITLLQLVVVI